MLHDLRRLRLHTESTPRPAGPRFVSSARVLAIQGADSTTIQDLLEALAERCTAAGMRVAGVVEETLPGVRKRNGGAFMRNLRTGRLYELFQDLGPHSTACCLDDRGVTDACQHVIADLADCDLVVLSKFGKLESERSGLFAAFTAAAFLEKPIITAVSPAFTASYHDFVGALGAIAPPDEDALFAWAEDLTKKN